MVGVVRPVRTQAGWHQPRRLRRAVQGAGGMARPVQLLPLQLGGGLLLLLVMHEGWRADPSAQAALAASAGQHADRLFSALHAEVAAEQGGHIKGFRCTANASALLRKQAAAGHCGSLPLDWFTSSLD